MRKFFLMALCALVTTSVWSSTVDDLVPISKNWTFIADDYTANGTVGLDKNTLYAGGKIFTPTGNSYANNKGSSTFGGGTHLNSLRLKLFQDVLVFKVAAPCTVVFYTQSVADRGIYLSKEALTSAPTEYWKKQTAATTSWEVELDEAGTYYMYNYGGDLYIAGFEVKFPLVDRSFVDFKIDFRQDPYTVLEPATGLPKGVELSNITFKDTQHGIQSGTIKVPVDGAVKFTIGACQFGNHTVTVNKNGEPLTTIDLIHSGGCDGSTSFDRYVTWTYNVEAVTDTLEFVLNGYMPYFFAQACDYVDSVVVRYYDTDGTTLLKSETVAGGSRLVYQLGAADVTVGEGQAFRGWFDQAGEDGLKVAENMPVEADLDLFAKATDIEVAATGNHFYYDLSKKSFYQEDHELISMTNGRYYNTHGWFFSANGTISVKVAGNAIVSILRCAYTSGGTITCTDGDGQQVGEAMDTKGATDGENASFRYTGQATTLTFTLSNGGYIHGVKVYNVENVPLKNDAGYYVMTANDGAGLLLMLETMDNGDMIFLPDGTYDLGTAIQTNISKSVSLIGQSMDGVLIVNHPSSQGMGKTETINLIADNIYVQDLAIRCDVSYEGSTDSGVGIALQIRGDKSILKHVDLQGNQDTYLSNGSATQRGWFEDGRIEGTVDYICGGGNMWFENTLLYNNNRQYGDVITAPATVAETEYGYVFNNCTVDGAAGQAGIWNFGRGWKYSPAATWLHTTCKIAPSAKGYTTMSSDLVMRFHEYDTHMEDGTAITGHSLDGLGYSDTSDAIYLSEEDKYTYANVILGEDEWDAAAIAAQVTANPAALDADAAYLVEDEGAFVAIVKGSELSAYAGKTIRQANTRGGFGPAVSYPRVVTAIDPTSALVEDGRGETTKILRDGQLIIVRDGKEYNALGGLVK
ncbi:MAG: pectinesterase family protein [Paludibacteraceae bacterium]